VCITIADGNYIFNETVQVSSSSGETARVKVWDASSRTLDVSMLTAMQFQVGERITGLESGAVYIIESVSYDQPNSYPNDEFKLINITIMQTLKPRRMPF